jgi:beta-phosphoglucomutase-like phosphatase (HAD superfamily)
MTAALLFDLDGTLVDADAEHIVAFQRAFAPHAKGLARAVVTNAPSANAELVLAAIGLAERLPTRVIGGELARSKPDPPPYLTALEQTGARAENSVAFEDSVSGVRAATAAAAAGLAVVGITTRSVNRNKCETRQSAALNHCRLDSHGRLGPQWLVAPFMGRRGERVRSEP